MIHIFTPVTIYDINFSESEDWISSRWYWSFLYLNAKDIAAIKWWPIDFLWALFWFVYPWNPCSWLPNGYHYRWSHSKSNMYLKLRFPPSSNHNPSQFYKKKFFPLRSAQGQQHYEVLKLYYNNCGFYFKYIVIR